jgi:hypothetical protein
MSPPNLPTLKFVVLSAARRVDGVHARQAVDGAAIPIVCQSERLALDFN